MSSVLTTPTATLADLLHSLGDIDPARIRLQPPPGTATEQHVLDIQAHEGRLCELVEYVLAVAQGCQASRCLCTNSLRNSTARPAPDLRRKLPGCATIQ